MCKCFCFSADGTGQALISCPMEVQARTMTMIGWQNRWTNVDTKGVSSPECQLLQQGSAANKNNSNIYLVLKNLSKERSPCELGFNKWSSSGMCSKLTCVNCHLTLSMTTILLGIVWIYGKCTINRLFLTLLPSPSTNPKGSALTFEYSDRN